MSSTSVNNDVRLECGFASSIRDKAVSMVGCSSLLARHFTTSARLLLASSIRAANSWNLGDIAVLGGKFFYIYATISLQIRCIKSTNVDFVESIHDTYLPSYELVITKVQLKSSSITVLGLVLLYFLSRLRLYLSLHQANAGP